MDSSSPEMFAGIALSVMTAALCCASVLTLAALVMVHYLIYRIAATVPPPYRKQEPWMVWLLLIPVFHLVWNFVVFPSISDGYKAYFDARGEPDVGDCGRGLGMAYAIVSVIMQVLGIGFYILSPMGCLPLLPLILLLIYIVELRSMKLRIEDDMPYHEPVEVV